MSTFQELQAIGGALVSAELLLGQLRVESSQPGAVSSCDEYKS